MHGPPHSQQHRLEIRGLGDDFVTQRLRLEIFRAGLQRQFHQLILTRRLARDDDLAAAVAAVNELIEALEEHDDVREVFSNAEFPEA